MIRKASIGGSPQFHRADDGTLVHDALRAVTRSGPSGSIIGSSLEIEAQTGPIFGSSLEIEAQTGSIFGRADLSIERLDRGSQP